MGPTPSIVRTTAVELFCGIGGFRLAADRLGIQTIWANDVNELACSVYRSRFGDGELTQGDIRTLIDQVPPHQLLTGGFPCQPFSAAGKKEGIRDPRGTLFQSIVDVLRRCQPEYFVLENVKRILSMEHGVHFATVLAALTELDYLVEWRLLSANHFGLAQARERVFIVGRRVRPMTYTLPKFSSVLASDEDLEVLPARLVYSLRQQASWTNIETHESKFPSWGLALYGKFIAHHLSGFSEQIRAPKLKDVLEENPSTVHDFTESTIQRLADSSLVERYVNGVEILSNQSGGARMGYTVFGIEGLAPTLTASTSRHYERYKIGDRYRRLTEIEYARLQGFKDDHCALAKPYDQYVLYGNAVPPPVAEWVLARTLTCATKVSRVTAKQSELFDA